LSQGRQPEVETSPLRRVLLPFRRKCQVVNAKYRALELISWALKRAKNLSNRPRVSMGYLSNRPQVSMGYGLVNHAGCW